MAKVLLLLLLLPLLLCILLPLPLLGCIVILPALLPLQRSAMLCILALLLLTPLIVLVT